VRLPTEHFGKLDTLTYYAKGASLQDFAYDYDLADNILKIHDATGEANFTDAAS